MAVSDPVSDFLTSIRNAYRAEKKTVTIPASKLKTRITEILKEEGYVSDFSIVEDGVKKSITIKLKYKKSGDPAITNIQKISKGGLRKYVHATKIPKVLNGLGVSILSTSKGVMTNRNAKRENVGGELLCKVW